MLSLMPYFEVRFRTEKMNTNEELTAKGYQGYLFTFLCPHTFTVLPVVGAIDLSLRLLVLRAAHTLCCPENNSINMYK